MKQDYIWQVCALADADSTITISSLAPVGEYVDYKIFSCTNTPGKHAFFRIIPNIY